MSVLVVAAAGYLIGSISFTRIVGRKTLPGVDLSETEYAVPDSADAWTYRGVSATSVGARAGWRWGALVTALDGLKAFVPTLALRLADPDGSAYAVVAVGVIVGHVWPVWWRFVGGRGQSSLIGALLAIDVLAIPVSLLASSLVGLLVLTSVYYARNGWPLALVPWFLIAAGAGPQLWFAVAANVVYWFAARGDLDEERRTRRSRGLPEMRYRDRLSLAWHELRHEE